MFLIMMVSLALVLFLSPLGWFFYCLIADHRSKVEASPGPTAKVTIPRRSCCHPVSCRERFERKQVERDQDTV